MVLKAKGKLITAMLLAIAIIGSVSAFAAPAAVQNSAQVLREYENILRASAGQIRIVTLASSVVFTPDPKTVYAAEFISKSEGQSWFLNEVERLLRLEQKSINTLDGVADLKNIRALGFEGHGITGKIPEAIGELTNLEYLFLGGNHFDGVIPMSLFSLSKLKNIDLADNNYSGAIPPEFGNMLSLETLILDGNNYTGNIPPTILANTNIKVLNVKSNKLTGGIPAGINGMTSLEYLNMSDNALNGSIPDMGALFNMKALSLWNCGLTGAIHSSIYTLTKLQILDLAQGGLDGVLSPAIGNLVDMQYLTVANNKIEGEIPDEIGDLQKLEKLNLADNKLRGEIPDVFTATTLVEVHLENNYLRGIVPATLKARYDDGAVVYLMNNYLTGTVLRDMPNNAKNFADGATTEQYQLTSTSSVVTVNENTTVNIYPTLRNRSYTSGNMTQKILLNPDEYTLVYNTAKFLVTVDSTGIHIKALTEVPLSENETIVICIKANDGSAYSTVSIKLTTDTVSGGGGIPSHTPDDPVTVTHKPYIDGYPDGTFKPNNNVTREQIAKMVIVALEITESNTRVTTYNDVARDRWSFGYIEAATERGYLQGFGGGVFGPDKAMTRAELATCLVRIAERLGRDTSGTGRTFSDVNGDEWYADYVARAAMLGLVNGYEDGTFKPERTVSRAEAVTMINRMLQRDPSTAVELSRATNPFEAGLENNWAYMQILEASIKHEH